MDNLEDGQVIGLCLSGILIFGNIVIKEVGGIRYFNLLQQGREVFHNNVRMSGFFVGSESGLIYSK